MKKFLYFSLLAATAFGALALVFFVHTRVYAQGPLTINPAVPGTAPTDNPAGIVSNLYQFALMVGGILAFGAIVYGGIKYVAAGGNPSSQSEGKEWIKGALWGLLLLVGASLILNTINRNITSLSLPDLPRVSNFAPSPPGSSGGYAGYGTGQCSSASAGAASVNALQNSCFADKAEQASAIAMAESGGNPFIPSGVDRCQPGGEPVSWGLFQINISANSVGGLNCRSAFDNVYTGSNHNCTIRDRSLYDQCVAAAKDPQKNIEAACQIYNAAGGWGPWGANRTCGF